MLFPVVGVYWGVVLLRDIAREDRVRMFIGFMVLCAGVLGLVSLLRSDPAPTAGYDARPAAGGVMGALAAHPLSGVISPIGAAIVCLGLTLLGLLIFTGTPVAPPGRTCTTSSRPPTSRRRRPAPAQLVVRGARRAEGKKERVRHLKEAFGLARARGRRAVVVPEADPRPTCDEA